MKKLFIATLSFCATVKCHTIAGITKVIKKQVCGNLAVHTYRLLKH